MKINLYDGVTCLLNDTLDLPLTARELGVFVFCLSRSQAGEMTTVTDLLIQFPELTERDIEAIEQQFDRLEERGPKKFNAATDRLAVGLWDSFVREAKSQ